MTYKQLLILWSCFILKQGLVAQTVPPPATQTEVNAGANRFKYVTPYTLGSWSGGGGGNNNTNGYSFSAGFTTTQATNVFLVPALSNLVANRAVTNVGVSNRFLISASETRITNAFKRHYFDTNVAHILSNLVATASSGDRVDLGAGDFYIGTQTIRVPVGVTLSGQGMGVTRIIGDVGVATNSIVQLMSTNIIQDLTVVAGKKSLTTFQYPIANLMIFGHPACTNVLIRRVEIDGETDCLLISQTNNTSGTIEDSYFHSAWDVCNILDLDDGNAQPGANWTIRRTRLYANSGTAQNPQGVANPKSQPFIVSGAIVDLINCELVATNHKAITISLQGFETNLVRIFDGTLQSAGTNGYGKQVDITTDSDNSVSTVKVSGTLINDTALAGSTVVSYEPRQVSTLYTSAIKYVNGFPSNSFLYLKADTNVAAGTFGSGLSFSGGTLTASGGGGGTNFPNINLLGQGTNVVFVAGTDSAFLAETNGNAIYNLSLAVPVSGQRVSLSVSNRAATSITWTLYTNSIASQMYDVASKANITAVTVAAGGQVDSELTWMGSYWQRTVKGEPVATLVAGYKTELITNGATITVQSTQRYTNYASASITINASTDVTANYTNAVAANNTITLTTPVIGTSGSLGLVSDASARTLAVLSPVAITWLSTNDTATATNILTTASKRSLFAWRVGMGTDGVSTNIHCWVKNQTP